METRVRSMESRRSGGTLEYNGDIIASDNLLANSKTMTDVIGKKCYQWPDQMAGMLPASPMEIDELYGHPGTYSGSSWYTARNKAFDYQYGPDYLGIYIPRENEIAREIENNQHAITLLELTNPFRNEYSVPLAAFELVELGSLFKIAASTFAGYVGGNFLNYKFGWSQLERDLKTLDSILEVLEKRISEFNRLFKHGGLRKKVKHIHGTRNSAAWNDWINSTWGRTIRGSFEATGHIRFSGSVRWLPRRDFKNDLSRLSDMRLAVGAVLDLKETTPYTMWQAFPFSWLADYFIDIGGALGASQGDDLIYPRDICIMRHYKATMIQVPEDIGPDWVLTKGKYTREIKSRDVVYQLHFPLPTISLFTKGQIENILALILSLKR